MSSVHEGIMVCCECGSENVEQLSWKKVNGGAYAGYYEGADELWCPDCEQHLRRSEQGHRRYRV
jgi:hypothetical protein